MIIRSVKTEDISSIKRLAIAAGKGMTLLPDEEVIAQKVSASLASFSGAAIQSSKRQFLCVAEDDDGAIQGITGIYPDIGPFSSFILQDQKVVRSEYLSGQTEIGTLYVNDNARRLALDNDVTVTTGVAMSFIRFMIVHLKPEWFAPLIFAEIRGWQNSQDKNSYFERVWKQYLQEGYVASDRKVLTHGFNILSRYPLYEGFAVENWVDDDKGLLGKPHDISVKAARILQSLGFENDPFSFDMLGGGPQYKCPRDDIGVVRDSRDMRVSDPSNDIQGRSVYLICNHLMTDFRAVVSRAVMNGQSILLPNETIEKLGVKRGNNVSAYPLRKPKC